MRLVGVTGGRGHVDEDVIHRRIDQEIAAYGRENLLFVHGDCRSGADRIADRYCRRKGVHVAAIAALWDYHGKPAGMRRNDAMSRLPLHTILAFTASAGPGTRGMIERATKAGIHVEIIK